MTVHHKNVQSNVPVEHIMISIHRKRDIDDNNSLVCQKKRAQGEEEEEAGG